jgi:hypothetical protein
LSDHVARRLKAARVRVLPYSVVQYVGPAWPGAATGTARDGEIGDQPRPLEVTVTSTFDPLHTETIAADALLLAPAVVGADTSLAEGPRSAPRSVLGFDGGDGAFAEARVPVNGLEVDGVSGGYVANAELALASRVYGAGDAVSYPSAALGRLRVEGSAEHDRLSGEAAAANMMGGATRYQHIPAYVHELRSLRTTVLLVGRPDACTASTYGFWLQPGAGVTNSGDRAWAVPVGVGRAVAGKFSLQQHQLGVVFFVSGAGCVTGALLWHEEPRQPHPERRDSEDAAPPSSRGPTDDAAEASSQLQLASLLPRAALVFRRLLAGTNLSASLSADPDTAARLLALAARTVLVAPTQRASMAEAGVAAVRLPEALTAELEYPAVGGGQDDAQLDAVAAGDAPRLRVGSGQPHNSTAAATPATGRLLFAWSAPRVVRTRVGTWGLFAAMEPGPGAGPADMRSLYSTSEGGQPASARGGRAPQFSSP